MSSHDKTGDELAGETVTVNSVWENLRSTNNVIEWFDVFATANQLDYSVQNKCKTIIDDLIMNIISYAFNGISETQIEIKIELSVKKLMMTIIDNGISFNPITVSNPETRKPVSEREVGGLGIYLYRELVDEVTYQRNDECNHLQLSINLPAGGTD